MDFEKGTHSDDGVARDVARDFSLNLRQLKSQRRYARLRQGVEACERKVMRSQTGSSEHILTQGRHSRAKVQGTCAHRKELCHSIKIARSHFGVNAVTVAGRHTELVSPVLHLTKKKIFQVLGTPCCGLRGHSGQNRMQVRS
jgi:hypothetical protein